MKTIVKNGNKYVVAEDVNEAMRMFKKQIEKRKKILIDDDEDRENYWENEKIDYQSYENNKDYYDYGV